MSFGDFQSSVSDDSVVLQSNVSEDFDNFQSNASYG